MDDHLVIGLSGDQSFSSPSLALLVTALKEICDSYYSVLETSQQLKKKMENLKELTSEEMKQVQQLRYTTKHITVTVSF